MPVAVSYPGVYIDEQRSGDVSISGVATSVALFIGMTQRGPLNVPQRVLNRTAFETAFGADGTLGETADQVRQFFLNGGGQAYVMRIANGAKPAKLNLKNEFGAVALSLEAREAGLIGNTIRVLVDYNTSRPETSFNLTVYRDEAGVGGDIRAVDVERHPELVTDGNSSRNVVDVLSAQSRLITASLGGVAATSGYMLGGVFGSGANAAAARSDLFTKISAAGPAIGRFEISVDDGPYVPVALTFPVTTEADIQNPINLALAPLGKQVTVSVKANLGLAAAESSGLLIASAAPAAAGTSVRIRSVGSADDIAAALQWSAEAGALEVGGGAKQRPMANGVLARLGSGAAQDLSALLGTGGLLSQDGANFTGLRLTDPSGAIAVPQALPAGGLYTKAGVNSLATGRAFIDTLAAAFNAAAAAVLPANRWVASRVGYRLAVNYRLGGSDVGAGVLMAKVGAGSYDIAAVNGYLATAQANAAAYRMNITGSLGYASAVAPAATDGIVPKPGDYDAAYDIVRREVDLFNLLVLPRNFGPPGTTGQTDADRDALWGAASAFCLQRRAVLLVDPHQLGWDTADSARAGLPALRNGMVKDHAAVFWPRLAVIDPASGKAKTIDPAGTVAGICARIDGSRGVWKAPAGLEASLTNVRGVEWRMSNEENGVINPEALNAIRAFASGIVVWGSRTMDGFDNSGNTDYRYLPVRRTALFIEESLYRGLQFAVFEPNAEPLWAQIRLAAGAFMNGLFRQGAFAAQKSSDAYFVKCDAETTTVTDQALGQVNVLVGFAPLRPAEFVVVTLKQKAGQVQA